MRATFLIAGAMFALTVTALPAAAEDDAQGADCFFAENRDDPLCRAGPLAAVVPARDVAMPAPSAAAPARYAVAPADEDSVDCFFAENREHPLCSRKP